MTAETKAHERFDSVRDDDAAAPFVLQPQEVILGLCGEYVAPSQLIWSGGMVTLLTDLGFSTAAARVSLNRVVARGLLQREREGRLVYYSMSARLKSLVEDGRRQTYFFRQQEEQDEWNGDWTFVWYSIPDDLRVAKRRLARRLSFLGFGSIQDGAWLMPRNRHAEVEALVHDLHLERHVAVLVGRPTMGLDVDSPIGRIWDLAYLAELYEQFVDRFGACGIRKTCRGLTTTQAFVVRTRIIDAFRQLASMDPKLPDSLTGAEWKRRQAVQLFQDATDLLYPAAKAYFDNTTGRRDR